MGRYSAPLAPLFADFAGVGGAQRVLDVGCGAGALTGELVARLGTSAVTAVDPSEPFVVAVRERYPGIDVRLAAAEELPFGDATFDVTLAQLVVHHMADSAVGLAEMSRVTRDRGVMAACVWDHEGGATPLSAFFEVARDLDLEVMDPAQLPGARSGHLGALFADARLEEVNEVALSFEVEHETFEEWWEPFTLGVGPVGTYVAGLDAEGQTRLGELCRQRIPAGPFVLKLRVWAARGVVPG